MIQTLNGCKALELRYNLLNLLTVTFNEYEPFGETETALQHSITNPVHIYMYGDYNRWLFNGKETQPKTGMLDYGARMYDGMLGRWISQDPLAEKYTPVSPYAFCLNNPIRYIDPDGMDVFRYDDETGTFKSHKETKDNFDQIGKFKYDKKTDSYELRTNRNGSARTRMDNIEKGILRDGLNLKTQDNVFEVGGKGQASVAGFEAFAITFSDMIGKEVSGYYMTENGKSDVSHIYMGKTINNSSIYANTGFNAYNVRPDLYEKIDVHTSYHTHLSRFPDNIRTTPSIGNDYNRGDITIKNKQLQQGIKKFIILTYGYPPIHY